MAKKPRKDINCRLFIIGNGFDRAHNMETSYGHFLSFYLKKIRAEFYKKRKLDNILVETTPNPYYEPFNANDKDIDSDIDEWIKHYTTDDKLVKKLRKFNITFKSDLFKRIYNNKLLNWVDIENEYFKELIKQHQYMVGTNYKRVKNIKTPVEKVNEEFSLIRDELIEYLTSLKAAKSYPEMQQLLEKNDCKIQYFLSFNYTDTLESYINEIDRKKGLDLEADIDIIYIHGSLNGDFGEPIFGLGDEHHDDLVSFKNSEHLSDLYKYNKSNLYFMDNNYSKLLSFIDSEPFNVEILGHSCGLSDRTLFKQILEHPNCNSVEVYHYGDIKDGEYQGKKDYFNKTIELSRHFDNPQHLREKIEPYDKNCSIPSAPISDKGRAISTT